MGKEHKLNSIYLFSEIEEVCLYDMNFDQLRHKFVGKDIENKGESNERDGGRPHFDKY
jgi:hypothetical protein